MGVIERLLVVREQPKSGGSKSKSLKCVCGTIIKWVYVLILDLLPNCSNCVKGSARGQLDS